MPRPSTKYDCPSCGAPAGTDCVLKTDRYETNKYGPTIVAKKGSPSQVNHSARNRLFEEKEGRPLY